MQSVNKQNKKYNIRVIPVKSPGFSGNKRTGYKMACNALIQLMDNQELVEKNTLFNQLFR